MRRLTLTLLYLILFLLFAEFLPPILSQGMNDREEFCYFDARAYSECVGRK